MSLLMDMTLHDFSELVVSKAPAPGGGSCAALSGLLGAALTMMVVNLSLGKKSYDALNESVRDKIARDYEVVQRLNAELTNLVDEDTKAFKLYMEALKLPQETETDKNRKTVSIRQASLYALNIPLQVAEKCLLLLEHQKVIALYGNKNAVSDVGVGAVLAYAGLESAALNVKIYLPGISDESIRKDAMTKIESCLLKGEKQKSQIIEVVNQRMAEI